MNSSITCLKSFLFAPLIILVILANTLQVLANENCPNPTIQISPGPYCSGETVVFEAPDPGVDCFKYKWDFGPNADPQHASGIGPHEITFLNDGIVNVQLSVENECPNAPADGISCFKIDPPISGSSNGITYVITEEDGEPMYLDVYGDNIISVNIKGGPVNQIYTQAPFTNLISQINPNNGKPYAISHFTICYECQNSASISIEIEDCNSVCDNITNGGHIGFGDNCDTYLKICKDGDIAPSIKNCESPSGGTGDIETIWLKNEKSRCAPINVTIAELLADPTISDWQIITGATDLYFDPGFINKTTCYMRCTRRSGCESYTGEAERVLYEIDPDCTPLPNCENIEVTSGNGVIRIHYPESFDYNAYTVFEGFYGPVVSSCFGSCGTDVEVNVSPGTYTVKVNYLANNFATLCQKDLQIGVSSGLLTNEQFHFDAIKHEEYAEMIWVHNKGELVDNYTLERSFDGTAFEAIEMHSSKGNTSLETYNGLDVSPALGDNYYRVKMEMLDGTVEYSDVKHLVYVDLIDFSVFPNPANQFVKVNLESVIGFENVTINIFNNLGVQVQTDQIDEVSSRYHTLDIRNLKEGHYIIWLDIPNHKPKAKKMVVAKK